MTLCGSQKNGLGIVLVGRTLLELQSADVICFVKLTLTRRNGVRYPFLSVDGSEGGVTQRYAYFALRCRIPPKILLDKRQDDRLE